MSTASDILLALISILFPPLAVWIKRGLCSCDGLINILLCCLGYIPGLLHAWYIIAKFPDESADYYIIVDEERGEARPRRNQRQGAQRQQGGYSGAQDGQRRQQQQQPNYGTTSGDGGEGSANGGGVPPSYDEAVRGDNKVQT